MVSKAEKFQEMVVQLLSAWKTADPRTPAKRVLELNRQIEELVKSTRATERVRSIRVSGDAMYVSDGAASYASEKDGARAVEAIKRLAKPGAGLEKTIHTNKRSDSRASRSAKSAPFDSFHQQDRDSLRSA